MAKIVAYDLDGTLTREVTADERPGFMSALYKQRTPNKKAIAQVRLAYNAGWTVVIFTGRKHDKRPVTERWLAENDVPYHFLIMGKLPYTYIVCDRARSLTMMDVVLSGNSADEPAAFFHEICREEFKRRMPYVIVPSWPEMPPEYRLQRRTFLSSLFRMDAERPPFGALLHALADKVHDNEDIYVVPWDNWPQVLEVGFSEICRRYGKAEGAPPDEPAKQASR